MKNNFIYHCLFWAAVYLLWVFVFRNYSFSLTKTLTVEFCYLAFITADYYIIIYYLLPRFLRTKQYGYFIAWSILLIAFSALLRSVVALQMNIHVFEGHTRPAFSTLFFTSLLNIFIWVELIVMGKMIADRIYNQQKLAIIEQQRMKHELDFLKAQINPHALFNSLNTIYGHIDKSNQTARNILLKFSGLLRYQLYDCSEDKISLEKEIEYIRNYISFQQIRKDDKLEVIIEPAAEPAGYMIAPLLLVVLIENAFKFVSSFDDQDNIISIKLTATDNLFTFCISNTTEYSRALQTDLSPGGIGITNLKRRLELLYPGKHELSLKQCDAYYEALLKLQLA